MDIFTYTNRFDSQLIIEKKTTHMAGMVSYIFRGPHIAVPSLCLTFELMP